MDLRNKNLLKSQTNKQEITCQKSGLLAGALGDLLPVQVRNSPSSLVPNPHGRR